MAEKKPSTTKKSEELVDIHILTDIPGLGDISIKKLNDDEIFTKRDMIVRGWMDVKDITGTDKDKVQSMMEYCRKQLQLLEDQWPTEMTALQMLEKRKAIKTIKTLSKNLNELIGGGFETRCITEIAGAFRSGKTQMAMSIALRAFLPISEGGLQEEGKQPIRIIYLDAENTFRPERLISMGQSSGIMKDDESTKDILSRFDIKKAQDPSHLILLLEKISSLIERWNYKVLVIDSGASLFRQHMPNLGAKGAKAVLQNNMMRLLTNFAEFHGLCIIYVNQVYETMDDPKYGDTMRRYGGHVVGHALTYRLTVKKSGKKWIATTTDFPHLPEQDCEFMVTEKGIEDRTK